MGFLNEDRRPLGAIARELQRQVPGKGRKINVNLLARWATKGVGPVNNRVLLEVEYTRQHGLLTSVPAVLRFWCHVAAARQPADKTRERSKVAV